MNTHVFETSFPLPAPVAEAFAWHERDGAFERLAPPWQAPRVIERTGTIRDGDQVTMVVPCGPLGIRWTARHFDYATSRRFRDEQVRGPFACWVHTHNFEPIDDGNCRLTDHIEYALPLGVFGRALGGRSVQRSLDRVFAYRHRTVAADLALHARFIDRPRLTVAVTGASGLIGAALCALLSTGGHRVIRLVRRAPGNSDEAQWDPARGLVDAAALPKIDAVVHLAGENIATGRWTTRKMQAIRTSRVDGTRALVLSLMALPQKPGALVTASAMGYYPSNSRDVMDEDGPRGEGFLADVVRDWEGEAMAAQDDGVRVVPMRIGLVLTPRGGALQKMLTPARMGLGGMLGRGDRYISWISLDDAIGGIYHALMNDQLDGPANLVAPQPATADTFVDTLGQVLGRPVLGRMPYGFGRLALGRIAEEMLVASYRLHPRRLLDTRYVFRHIDLESAFRHLLGRYRPATD